MSESRANRKDLVARLGAASALCLLLVFAMAQVQKSHRDEDISHDYGRREAYRISRYVSGLLEQLKIENGGSLYGDLIHSNGYYNTQVLVKNLKKDFAADQNVQRYLTQANDLVDPWGNFFHVQLTNIQGKATIIVFSDCNGKGSYGFQVNDGN